MAEPAIERGSGNVFADLRIPQPEEHKLKAALVSKLADVIQAEGLKQVEAAKLARISQPDLSRLLRGQFRDVSVERLIRALRMLGSEVEIGVIQHGRRIGEPIHLEAMAN
jgi:predicted XRE-type DNA-binding protein